MIIVNHINMLHSRESLRKGELRHPVVIIRTEFGPIKKLTFRFGGKGTETQKGHESIAEYNELLTFHFGGKGN